MKHTPACRTFSLVFCLLFAGCAAVELRDANEQLTNYYLAKVQAEVSNDWKMLEASVASLQALAVETAGRADAAQDRRNRVSLYRIAATAAWQAGDSNVVAYGQKGQQLCDDATFNEAPRDCGMLLVIPTLASVAETTERANALQPQLVAAGDDVTEDMAAEARQIHANYSAALESLLSRRRAIQASDAHPMFKEQLDNNIGILACSHLDTTARGLLVLAGAACPCAAAGSPAGAACPCDLDEELTTLACDAVREGVPRDLLRCASAGCR